MAYKANAKRRDEGGYDLSYGKSSKKLTDIATLDAASNRWGCDSIGETFKLFRDLKAAWSEWAVASYEGSSITSASAAQDQTHTTTTAAPHSPHSGPPKHKGIGGPPKKLGVKRIDFNTDDVPLPILKVKGKIIQADDGFVVCEQIPTERFPYTDGFAIVEFATNRQVGWTKMKDRALESLGEHTRETHVRETTQAVGASVRKARPAHATGTDSEASQQAASTDDSASEDEAEFGIPVEPGADTDVQGQLFAAEEPAA